MANRKADENTGAGTGQYAITVSQNGVSGSYVAYVDNPGFYEPTGENAPIAARVEKAGSVIANVDPDTDLNKVASAIGNAIADDFGDQGGEFASTISVSSETFPDQYFSDASMDDFRANFGARLASIFPVPPANPNRDR